MFWTVTVTAALPRLPAASQASTAIVCGPSATVVVSHGRAVGRRRLRRAQRHAVHQDLHLDDAAPCPSPWPPPSLAAPRPSPPTGCVMLTVGATTSGREHQGLHTHAGAGRADSPAASCARTSKPIQRVRRSARSAPPHARCPSRRCRRRHGTGPRRRVGHPRRGRLARRGTMTVTPVAVTLLVLRLLMSGAVTSGASGPPADPERPIDQRHRRDRPAHRRPRRPAALVEAPVADQAGLAAGQLGGHASPALARRSGPRSTAAARRGRRRYCFQPVLSRPICSGAARFSIATYAALLVRVTATADAVDVDGDAVGRRRTAAAIVGHRQVMPRSRPAPPGCRSMTDAARSRSGRADRTGCMLDNVELVFLAGASPHLPSSCCCADMLSGRIHISSVNGVSVVAIPETQTVAIGHPRVVVDTVEVQVERGARPGCSRR